MYQLRLANSAQKDLDKLQGNLWERVSEAIRELGETPRPPGTIKLRGGLSIYRIRVGDYRILYEINDSTDTVLILRVKHRREVYRGLS
jgi:mRNA interferase RelE/StbE